MKIGFVGLGKMGKRMVEKLLLGGHTVVVWNRTKSVVDEFSLVVAEKKLADSFTSAEGIKSLVYKLQPPRIIWLMLPAGEATESVIRELDKYIEKGDILIDGGNSYYKDTEKRFRYFQQKEIRYLGIGVSGGIKAAKTGYPMMIGGDISGFNRIKPLLETLIKPHGGYEYFGEGGAGHFVKMVHNGIEYGMMQAIGEGFGVLEKSPYNFDLVKVAKLWQRGTIITSYLMECARNALEKDPTLSKIDGVIDTTGEAEWTVLQAKEERVPIENIEQALTFRYRSKIEDDVRHSLAARMIAALRHEFGGHTVHKK
jgi:6-phosphogluconate dehydrogenase